MRGADISLHSLFITRTVEDLVPTNGPLRAVRKLIDEALRDLDAHFNRLYADEGRESALPERLIRARCCRYSTPSKRAATGGADSLRPAVSLVCRSGDGGRRLASRRRQQEPGAVADETSMSRLIRSALKVARRHKLLSAEHFGVDGTLIDVWASHKSFRPRDADDDTRTGRGRDCHGERRCNDTHASTTTRMRN